MDDMKTGADMPADGGMDNCPNCPHPPHGTMKCEKCECPTSEKKEDMGAEMPAGDQKPEGGDTAAPAGQ